MENRYKITILYERAKFIADFIASHTDIGSTLDIGSGVGRTCKHFKNHRHVEVVNFIDKDYEALVKGLYTNYQPSLTESIWGRYAEKPVNINVYHGDAAVPDERLISDLINMSYVIEYQTEENLSRLTSTVFGFYQPKYCLIMTPNSDIYRLYSDRIYEPNSCKDQKFQWNRNELSNYCKYICQTYPQYSCRIDGVGHLDGGASERFGPCTQIAIFTRSMPDSLIKRNITDFVPIEAMFDACSIKTGVDCSLRRITLVNKTFTRVNPSPEPVFSQWNLEPYQEEGNQQEEQQMDSSCW